MEVVKLEPAELAKRIVDIIADKKGEDIIMMDLQPVSTVTDYFVLCSGNSERQVRAIVEDTAKKLKELGVLPLHIEGTASSGWVLMDYNSVIVHVFVPEVRQYYRLERLWSDAPVIVRVQ